LPGFGTRVVVQGSTRKTELFATRLVLYFCYWPCTGLNHCLFASVWLWLARQETHKERRKADKATLSGTRSGGAARQWLARGGEEHETMRGSGQKACDTAYIHLCGLYLEKGGTGLNHVCLHLCGCGLRGKKTQQGRRNADTATLSGTRAARRRSAAGNG